MLSINLAYSKQKVKNIWFHLFLSLYLIATYLNSSMLVYKIPVGAVTYFLFFVSLFLLLRAFLFEEFRFQEIIIIIFWLVLTFGIAYKLGNIRIFTDSLVIVSCKGISFKKIVKNYVIVSFAFLFFISVFSRIGFVPDLIFYRDGSARHSLGLMYPTVYSARVFFLLLGYLYLRGKNIKLLEVIFLLGLSYLLLEVTGGRLDSYLLIMAIILFYLFSKINVHLIKIFSLIACFAPFIGATLSYYSALAYNNMNPLHVKINNLFSTRLFLGHWALSLYKPLPFGQIVYEQGNGGLEGYNNIANLYFFIDSSYLSILLKNGWIFFVALLLLLTYKLFSLYKSKKYYLILAWSFVCINSMVATYLYSVPANIFILFLFSNLENEQKFKQ